MSSKTHDQCSGNRKKIDFQLIETANSRMENTANVHWHKEGDSSQPGSNFDVRKSLAWDSAFFTSPGVLDNEELFETLNFRVIDNVDKTTQRETMLSSFRFLEPERTHTVGECSVRKSLSWDSAFFTSGGVLDAEELSIVNRGFKNPEISPFPKAEEAAWKSAESNTTVNRDSYSLASLEIDLFDDAKATLNKPQEALSSGLTSTYKLRRQKRVQNGIEKPAASPGVRLAASNGKSPLSSLKPPKITSCTSLSIPPKKRASLGASHGNIENKATKVASGKNTNMSKRTCLRASSSTIPGSTPSVKLPTSALPSSTKDSKGFGSALPNLTGKTPPRSRWRHLAQNELVTSNDSSSFLFTPKPTSHTSPASSIDGWSSESSSSSSSANQRTSKSSACFLTSPPRAISLQPSDSKSYFHHRGSLETTPIAPKISKDLLRSSHVSDNVSRNLRTSGLRMPSPKIGFFDAEKSTFLAENGCPNVHFDVQQTSSKIRNGNSNVKGTANRSSCLKQRLGETSTKNVKLTGTTIAGRVCLREKNLPLKEDGSIRVYGPQCDEHRLDEVMKENVGSFENQIEDLSRSFKAINFSRAMGYRV